MKKLLSLAAVLFALHASAAVVQPIGAAPQLLIPAAGSLNGQNGTFFRSDITLVNLATHDQIVQMRWLPQPGAPAAVATMTLRSLAGFRSSDFVADMFHSTGLGAIVVTGLQSGTTNADSTARLFVSSRIWTNQPGTTGTTSQDLPAIPPGAINTPASLIFGMGGSENAPNYRTNVGIVNLDPVATQTFSVQTQRGTAQTVVVTVVLPPMTMTQVPVGMIDGQQISVTNETAAASPHSNLWIAYGSTVDNTTGDAWSEIGVSATPSTP